MVELQSRLPGARLLALTSLFSASLVLLYRWASFGERLLPSSLALAFALTAVYIETRGPRRLQPKSAPIAGVALCLLAGVYFLGSVVEIWAFTTDDAYITLRYARNWVEGHGIRWNPGESPPVEGYSNFPYLLLGAAGLRLGIDPALALKAVSVASAVAMLAVVFFMLRHLVGWLLSGVAVLYLALFPGSAWWSVSGLETACYQLLVAGAFALSLPLLRIRRERDGHEMALAGFVSFLAAWIRPEGVLVAGTLLPALFLSDLHRLRKHLPWQESLLSAARRALPFAASFLLPYLLYFSWRWSYFGRLVPNTVLCKAGSAAEPWRLIRELHESHAWVVWLAPLALVRHRDPRVLAMAAMAAVSTAILYGVHPAIAHWNRHSLGVLPLFVGLAMVGVAVLTERLRQRDRLLAALPLFVVVAFALPLPHPERLAKDARTYEARNAVRLRLAQDLDALAGDEEPWVFFGDAGVTPYHSRLRYLDAYCLNAREATAPPISGSAPLFAAYVLQEKKPEFIVVHSSSFDELTPHIHRGIWEAVLEQPAFASEYELAWRMNGDHISRYWVFRRKEGSRAGAPVLRGDDVVF